MNAKALLISTTVVAICLSLASSGCGPGGDEAAAKVTKEAAGAAGKALQQWQRQNR